MDEGDVVFQAVLGQNYALLRDGVCAPICGCDVPWMYDAYGRETISKLTETPPKVAFFDPDATVWGYRYADYAPDITEFIMQNYTKLDETAYFYVRNDLL